MFQYNFENNLVDLFIIFVRGFEGVILLGHRQSVSPCLSVFIFYTNPSNERAKGSKAAAWFTFLISPSFSRESSTTISSAIFLSISFTIFGNCLVSNSLHTYKYVFNGASILCGEIDLTLN